MNIEKSSVQTPICKLSHIELENHVYIKRDDLYPLSFGGNKARKAELFWKDIKRQNSDYVMTYGSSSSNHCRVIANLAAMDHIPCILISPLEKSKNTYNLDMMKLFGAKVITTPVENVKRTIDDVMGKLRDEGFSPYFIMGGGHGNIGTQAYVDVYEEIKKYELKEGFKFDYVFFASGTGTTQAGLICGQIMAKETERKIVGISIARKNPYGRNVVIQSVRDYLNVFYEERFFKEEYIEFIDEYTGDGYGDSHSAVDKYIMKMLIEEGIPMDQTYTGKAFAGMCDYLEKHKIEGKNILFIHTGGLPLFFDYLSTKRNGQ